MQNTLIDVPIWVSNLDIDTEEMIDVSKDLFIKHPAKHELEKGDAQSSYGLTTEIGSYAEFNILRDLVIQNAKEYWGVYGLDARKEPEIHDSWMNRHGKGGSTFPHFHAQTPIAGVFYIQFEEGMGNLFMQDPLHYHKANEPRMNWESELELPIQEKDLVLFPGWIQHWTGINMLDNDRIIMSFNIGYK